MKDKRLQINLLSDIHGFPTYAVHYKQTRYNFCHLEDVCDFIKRVYKVDNEKLLRLQPEPVIELHKPFTPHFIPTIYYHKKPEYKKLDEFILSLCDKPTISKEVCDYVKIQHPELPTKTVHNRLLQLTEKGILKKEPFQNSRKVCTYVVPR
jgi:hypothetical protein